MLIFLLLNLEIVQNCYLIAIFKILTRAYIANFLIV